MEQIISKEELEEFKKIKGEVKGVALKENMEFILKEEGRGNLEKLEKILADFGCPITYKNLKEMIFYPLWYDAVLLTVIERLFNYDDKKFQEMGRFEPKISFIIRIFMKYFISLERAAREAPKIWRQTFTVGDLEVVKLDESSGVLRLQNYRLVPVQCQVLKGYFASVLGMVVGGKVECEEIKCVFKGDEYHEFLLKW